MVNKSSQEGNLGTFHTYSIEYRGRIIIQKGGFHQKQIADDEAYVNEKKVKKRLTCWTAVARCGAIVY